MTKPYLALEGVSYVLLEGKTLFCELNEQFQGLTKLEAAPHRAVLEQMLTANRMTTEGELRMRLAQLGLGAQKITAPSGSFSGRERLKAVLACALYADPPA